MAVPSLYDALSHPPDRAAGNAPDLSVYRAPGAPSYGSFRYHAPAHGLVATGDAANPMPEWTDRFDIAWTKQGDRGPLVVFLHGVPTNRMQWEPIQRLMAPFCRTISVDMLGMGESSQPRMYGQRDGHAPNALWRWVNDTDWLEQLMQHEFPGQPFVLVADDWGGGIAAHYAARFPERVSALALLDPVAFDGYPVNEIQAVGRAAQCPNTQAGDAQFAQLMAAFDQTLAQILKSMVYRRDVYNQYSIRAITFPYVETDYERNAGGDGVSGIADSMTLRLKLHNIRVLADRASVLAPAQLLPHHPEKNPHGVAYETITMPTLVAWGEYDEMMPAGQIHRFANVLGTDDVETRLIPRAGHFAHTDQPVATADALLGFIRRTHGRRALADVYMGLDGIWKGDERALIRDLRAVYGVGGG
ncbi:alpha/beta fold hydrolase [Limimonas halophila]|nr:alpha/beta hydrolase [Limimonas halophila]